MNNTTLWCEREDLTRADALQFESISYTAVEKQKTAEALWDGYCVCDRDSLGFNGTGVGFDALGFISSTCDGLQRRGITERFLFWTE